MNFKLILKYFLPATKKYRKNGLAVFLFYGLSVIVANVIQPLIYKRIMDIVAEGNLQKGGEMLPQLILFLAITMLFYNIFFRLGDYCMTLFQSKVLKDLADDALARLEKHSFEFFTNNFSGSLVTRVKRYVRSFETIHDQLIFLVWMNGLQLTLSVAVLTYYSLILGMIFLAWMSIYLFLIIFLTKKRFQKDLLVAEAESKTTGALADIITNILNVKIFTARNQELQFFENATANEEKLRFKAWQFGNIQFTIQGLFIAFFEFTSMATALYLWQKGVISAGIILLIQIYILSAFSIVWNIGRSLTRLMQALAETKEMIDIFEEPVSVQDPIYPKECKISRGEITIQNLSFNYKKTRKVFSGFSLHIKAGEKIGLVGSSGSGKSSLVKLLLRFADPQSGSIFIDGQNIAHLKQDNVRSMIAYVPQDSILFHRTIKENIAYAKPKASEREIIKAAKLAHAHEFINEFPEKYDTYVGERGVKLSGGERQRISIARAMLKKSPILILDEATSSLDSLSEKYIQESFENLSKGRTSIVIAHRLSTIQKMDRIIVLDNGKIVEEGNHKKLLAKKGFYHKLWQQQTLGFIGA